MNYLLAIIYILSSFLFTFWLIDSSGNYWWVLLLIFLIAGLKTIEGNKDKRS